MIYVSYIIKDVLYYIPSGSFDSNMYVYGKEILIDTGYSPGYARTIVDHFIKYEINLKKVILTHIHPDHSSNIDMFKLEFNADVCVHKNIANKFSKYKEKLIILNEGDYVKVNDDLQLKVIHTPGHSPGGLCLYDEKNKILFSGDTVFSHGNIGRTDLGGDINQLINSIEKLLKLDVEYLCPGHMDAVKNGNDHIKKSYEFAKRVSSWGM